jgi:hypothetical protein
MIFREEPEWQDYIGPVRLSLTLPESKPAGNEPLVVTGRAGAGDLLFLHYESDGSARVGWDHWGAETTLSPSFPIPENRRIELVVSMGSLLPPDGSPLYAANPDFALLRNRLEVDLGDRPLLSRSADFYPCAADDVTFGANLIGGSTVAMTFAGTVDRIGLEAATEIVGRLATSQVAAASPGPRWEGYPGPVRIRLTFPKRPASAREPLLVTGATGGGDFVFVHYVDGGRIRLGFDHWGAGGPESGEFAPGGEGPGILLVSHGGLMPPPDAPLYREHPELLTLRDWLVVAYNGQPILVQRVPHHPSLPAQITAGSNRIGGSSTGARFSGDIFMIGSAPAEAVRALISAAEERGRAP